MADRVTLSCWVRGYTAQNMLANFEKLLWRFPFSRLRPLARLTIYAVDYSESPIDEHVFEGEVTAADIVDACGEFQNSDCAYELEAYWELWRYEDEQWTLAPATVLLTCYAPLFPSEMGEQLRIDFGAEDQFLPPEDDAPALRAVKSNVQSLLRFAEDVGEAVPLEKRLLWSEDGDNLAERLQEALAEDGDSRSN